MKQEMICYMLIGFGFGCFLFAGFEDPLKYTNWAYIGLFSFIIALGFMPLTSDTMRGKTREPSETKADPPPAPRPKMKSLFGENYLFKLKQETAYVSALCEELKDIEMTQDQKIKVLQIIQDQYEWHIGMMPFEPEYEIDPPQPPQDRHSKTP